VSLRQPPERTPELLGAARANAQHSTGPRTEAGKLNSRLNALKHGERSDPGNHRLVMLALGEDPEDFEYLKKELLLSYGPGEILWQKQIDDLARLYWRRQRLERAQEGVMRRARLAVEERQHHRRREMAAATFHPAQAPHVETAVPADPGVRLRLLLSFLQAARHEILERALLPWQASKIEPLYQEKKGWREIRLLKLLRLHEDGSPPPKEEGAGGGGSALPTTPDPSLPRRGSNVFMPGGEPKDYEVFPAAVPPGGADGEQSGGKPSEPRQQEAEVQRQELLRLLEEEIAGVQEEFQYAEKLNEEKVSIERDACLAPEGEQWQMMLRREAALDRSIDRKVKILLAMRKEFTMPKLPPGFGGLEDEVENEIVRQGAGSDILSMSPPTLAARRAGSRPEDRAAGGLGSQPEKVNEQTGNVTENKGGGSNQPAISGLQVAQSVR